MVIIHEYSLLHIHLQLESEYMMNFTKKKISARLQRFRNESEIRSQHCTEKGSQCPINILSINISHGLSFI